MLSDKALQELLDYESSVPVLSVYLNTDITPDAYKLTLRSMLKGIEMPADEEAALRYIEHEYARQGRSVALFSCAEENFFRAYPLSVAVHSRIHVAEKPYVRPLANLLDAYGAYGVALVDKQGARFFYFHLGQLVEQEGMLGEEVRQNKGNTSAHGRRSYEDTGVTNLDTTTAKKNFKEAAEYAVAFFEKQKVRRILLGGTDENTAHFQQQLPKSWQSLIVGSFAMDMNANQQQILDETLKVGAKAEEKREAALVQQMITSAAKAAEGVAGLAATLPLTRDGRVQTLLVDENYHAPGYQCESCGYLTAEAAESCAFCGGTFAEIEDATETAIRAVMLSGGVVEIVRDNADMEEIGIGALLRY
jgi:peptide chain release factor subunit 1